MIRHVLLRLPTYARAASTMSSSSSVLSKASSLSSTRILHQSSTALAVLVPVAVAVNPSVLSLPVDLALAVVLPVHSALAIKCVIEDYIPRPGQTAATAAWFAVCGITALGLVKLSITGSGLVNTVKELWRDN